jgi:hypothetical protein
MKDETYYFHQTPNELCKKLIKEVPLIKDDYVLEPFRGEGAFYNNFPDFVNKDYCEIEERKDYKDYDKPIDWVITNPPFSLYENGGKRVSAFYKLIEYYADKAKKGIAFLGNDFCLSSLTPLRLKELNENHGLYIHKIIVCNIKKWRGRYFFIIFKKEKNDFYKYIEGSF